jgi:hypothetical protein
VISIIALCVALGGTAYAAKKIGTKNLKNGAVSTKKLKNEAVTEAKLAAGAVTDSKLGAIVMRSTQEQIGEGETLGVPAECLPGEKLVGGGARFAQWASDMHLVNSAPARAFADTDAPPDGSPLGAWRAVGVNPVGGGGQTTFHVYALCLQ